MLGSATYIVRVEVYRTYIEFACVERTPDRLEISPHFRWYLPQRAERQEGSAWTFCTSSFELSASQETEVGATEAGGGAQTGVSPSARRLYTSVQCKKPLVRRSIMYKGASGEPASAAYFAWQ